MTLFIKSSYFVCFILIFFFDSKSQNISLISSSNNIYNKKNIGTTYFKEATIQKGYTLLTPSNSTKTFLIDNQGRIINQWSSNYLPGQSAYLTEDGCLIRTCKTNNTTFKLAGIGGRLEKKDWNDQLIWEWELNDTNKCLHHDISPLPNGNILVILVERKFLSDIILSGRDTSKLSDKELWTESVLELQPKGKNEAIIVWQWNAWDHLTQNKYPNIANYSKIATSPELIDINYNLELNSTADFLHFNSIDYNQKLDQILVSVRNFNEIWIIDHSTNSKQSKSHSGGKRQKGGDLIYRWGNPKSYGINEPAQLDGQHSASWVKNGYTNDGFITIFDNRSTTQSSRLVMINPFLNKKTLNYVLSSSKSYLPNTLIWNYTQKGLSEGRGGSVTALPNGNFLFCETSKGKLTEITPHNDTAWIYNSPVTSEGLLTQGSPLKNSGAMFKADKYPPFFKGFIGKKMTPGVKLELNSDMTYGRIEITKTLDTLKAINISLVDNNYLYIDEKKLLYNTPIFVYNAKGELIDRQIMYQNSKWYLGLYKEGTYYFECNKQIVKVQILNRS